MAHNKLMKLTFHRFLGAVALISGICGPVRAAEPDAAELLRGMSAKLASAPGFQFQAVREIDASLLEGRDVAEKAKVSVAVTRPGKLAATSSSKTGSRRMVADGTTLSLLDVESNYHAVLPMRTDIDGLVAKLDRTYGFTPPLAEFVVSDPGAKMRGNAQTVTYLGRAKDGGFLGLGGVACHRIGLSGAVADAELWIGVADQLPRRLVATFKRDGQPQVRIRFKGWQMGVPAASQFAFVPPSGSEKIEMWSTAEMDSAAKR